MVCWFVGSDWRDGRGEAEAGEYSHRQDIHYWWFIGVARQEIVSSPSILSCLVVVPMNGGWPNKISIFLFPFPFLLWVQWDLSNDDRRIKESTETTQRFRTKKNLDLFGTSLVHCCHTVRTLVVVRWMWHVSIVISLCKQDREREREREREDVVTRNSMVVDTTVNYFLFSWRQQTRDHTTIQLCFYHRERLNKNVDISLLLASGRSKLSAGLEFIHPPRSNRLCHVAEINMSVYNDYRWFDSKTNTLAHHTHTHTHARTRTEREKEREREKGRKIKSLNPPRYDHNLLL